MTRRDAHSQELSKLTKHFRDLGAIEPESWAKSQLEGGFPEYARFVFLRHAWTTVIEENDTSWIEPTIQSSERRPRDPGAGAGPALKRLLAAGASRDDIAEVVRVMQWHVLSDIVYQLEDSGVVEYPSDELPRVHWMLFEVTEEGEPLHPINALYQSILDTEPSGREMRPKGVGREG